MDQKITVVAEYSDRRQICWTASGFISLLWDEITLTIPPVDFNRMVNVLEEGVFEVNLCRISCGQCWLMQARPGCFYLGVKNIGFDLSLSEFLNLVRLVREAARQLKARHGLERLLPPTAFEKETLCVTSLPH
ncbi:MAG: hypothetical protein KDJ52_21040 [Anaerolineae bacterium]|nr:hypothetical protein [Anaerolineae bacterium]